MQRDNLQRVFIASDEQQFIDHGAKLFGDTAFWLPLEAVSTTHYRPAFRRTDIPGEIKAREALVTMVVLSRARLLVKTASLLSAWAMTLADEPQRVVLVS